MDQVDLEMPRGDTAVFDVVIKDSEQKTINLSGGTLKFTARAKSGDTATVLSKSSPGSGIIFTDAVNGVAALTIDPADTEGLYAPCTLVYDFEFTAPAGAVTTVLPAGVLYILRDITHS